MRLFDFLRYYFDKVIKKWWIVIAVFIPALKPVVLSLDQTYYKSVYSKNIETIFNLLNPFWIWVAVAIFLIIHLPIIYKLWVHKVNNPFPAEGNILPSDYSNIIRKIEQLAPEVSANIKENFYQGYVCLTELSKRDVKTAICIHFNAYKSVRDVLLKCFNGEITGFQITVEASDFKAKFENNFSTLKEYYNIVGNNESLTVGEHEVGKLVRDMNDNLNSLLIL